MPRRKPDPRQLDFFDRLVVPPPPPPPPEWRFPAGHAHTDFIPARELATVFLYRPDALDAPRRRAEAALAAAALAGLAALAGAHPALRRRAFTVYLGPAGPDDALPGVALGTTDARVVAVLEDHLRLPALDRVEVADRGALPPRFRYDHGHIVEYVDDPDLAGTTRPLDLAAGPRLVLHRRLARPAAELGRAAGAYARLVDPERP